MLNYCYLLLDPNESIILMSDLGLDFKVDLVRGINYQIRETLRLVLMHKFY